ncbi:MAG: hexose kinase [Chloroflexota bacterium]
MILCVTPNPTIDRTVIVPSFGLGSDQQYTQILMTAAGKGINMARAMLTLGGDPLCAGFLGGYFGRVLDELAIQDGLQGAWTWVQAETRNSFIFADSSNGTATVINEQGPTILADDWRRLQADVLREAVHADYGCFSGSLPPGVLPEIYGELVRALHETGCAVWVDSSGAALQAAVAAAPINLKVNGAEAGTLLGIEVNSVETALHAATQLQREGNSVAITLGELGAVLVNESGRWLAQPPALLVVSAVGSGDSFFAGLITALAAKLSPQEAMRWAVAAGGANALSLGAGVFTRHQFEVVLAETTIHNLSR